MQVSCQPSPLCWRLLCGFPRHRPACRRGGATVSICQNHARKPFIVREISADMLRRHPQLSKGARMLWLTMRGMADHRTGELRHRQHWFTGEEIDKRAEISTRRRKDLMKELVNAGFVQWERERVTRFVTDRLTGHRRMRRVLGPTHYLVVRDQPKNGGSSKVQSLHGARNAPTSLSELHQEGAPSSK